MNFRKILLTSMALFTITTLIAQNAEDALRYSSYSTTGTARFMSLSGALGAIGGDLTTINNNPAGLGIYKSSEYIFAPRYLYNKVESNFGGEFRSDSRDNINFGTLGLVTSMPVVNRLNPDAPGWKYVQFGFSVNRIDNYCSDITIEGNSIGGSKVNEWRSDAQGNLPENLNYFGSNLAWETYLLDTINGYPTDYITAVPVEGVNQKYTSSSKGYKNEMTFAFSGNYNNKLFLGMGMSFVFLNYSKIYSLTETALITPNQGEFDSFTYYDELSTRGNGINAKLGVIYMITPAIRISGAFHSPTWYYNMTDSYFSRVESQMFDGQKYNQSSPNGKFNYTMTTPFRASAGIGIVIGQMGFVSADYEYLDYSLASFNSTDYAFSDENQDIKTDFLATHNVRIGTEWNLNNFFIRGGYGFSTSPVDESLNKLTHDQYSFGFGYRSGPLMLDFAFLQKLNNQKYYIYDPNFVNAAYIESKTSYYGVTLGLKF
jgi:hypothetical protein